MNKLLLFLLVCLTLSCTQEVKQNKDNSFSMNQPELEINKLKNLIINKGDTSAYNQLDVAFLDQRHEEFIIYALVMANKYDYPKAYYDVFSCICDIYGDIDKLSYLDSQTRQFALNYLTLSVQKGYEIGKGDLSTIMLEGKYMKKNIKLGKKYQEEYNQLLTIKE